MEDFILELEIPSELVVLQYHFIDFLNARIDPKKIFGDSKKTQDAVEAVKQIFIKNGWEGDGEIKMIWLPPFLDQSRDNNFGDFIWHVKQSNDGTSFLGFKEVIQSARLLEQNKVFKENDHEVKPISLIYTQKKYLLKLLLKKRELLNEIITLSNKEAYSSELKNLTLGYLQNDIISDFNDFIDECYLEFLVHVLSHNNPDSINLRSMSARISLDQISETAQETAGSGDHWLTIHQIIGNIWKDFKFLPFKEKFKEIMNCIEYSHDQGKIADINKHVVIRNCIQHHQWELVDDVLKTIGQDKIRILNEKGKYITIKKWGLITLTIEEVEYLLKIIADFTNEYATYVKTRIKTRSFLHNYKEEDYEAI